AAPSGPCSATEVHLSAALEVSTGGCTFDLSNTAGQPRNFFVEKRLQMTGLGFITVINANNVDVTATGRLEARGDFVEQTITACVGGTNDGAACTTASECPGGTCTTFKSIIQGGQISL